MYGSKQTEIGVRWTGRERLPQGYKAEARMYVNTTIRTVKMVFEGKKAAWICRLLYDLRQLGLCKNQRINMYGDNLPVYEPAALRRAPRMIERHKYLIPLHQGASQERTSSW